MKGLQSGFGCVVRVISSISRVDITAMLRVARSRRRRETSVAEGEAVGIGGAY